MLIRSMLLNSYGTCVKKPWYNSLEDWSHIDCLPTEVPKLLLRLAWLSWQSITSTYTSTKTVANLGPIVLAFSSKYQIRRIYNLQYTCEFSLWHPTLVNSGMLHDHKVQKVYLDWPLWHTTGRQSTKDKLADPTRLCSKYCLCAHCKRLLLPASQITLKVSSARSCSYRVLLTWRSGWYCNFARLNALRISAWPLLWICAWTHF